jgi:uncharacterized membrane protein YqjE
MTGNDYGKVRRREQFMQLVMLGGIAAIFAGLALMSAIGSVTERFRKRRLSKLVR